MQSAKGFVVKRAGPGSFWRATNYVLLVMGLGALIGAIGFLLITFGALEQLPRTGVFTEVFRKFLVTMAVVVGVLLIFLTFCTALLVIRYFSHRIRRLQGRHGPTPYVDAWKLAGQRFKLPEEDASGQTDTGEFPPKL